MNDCRSCEGMREILRRVQERLNAGGYITRLDRDDLLESIGSYLARRPVDATAQVDSEDGR